MTNGNGLTSPNAAASPATLTTLDHFPSAPTTTPQFTNDVEAVRVTAEVQGAMVMAKRFPRDENAAFNKIITACKRKSLAESAMYAYKRGGQMVTGPSIRLAEVLAQAWGNLYMGVKEVGQEHGESKMIAFAWDLESNTKDVREFVVKHERDTRDGKKQLTDSRDIYEMTANLSARRKRAAILAILPADVVEAAVAACNKTLAGDGSEPIEDRIRKMLLAFKEVGVSQELIEQRLGHKIEATIGTELVQLQKIFVSIRDGMSKREEWFSLGGGVEKPASAAASALNEKLAKTAPKKTDAEAPKN